MKKVLVGEDVDFNRDLLVQHLEDKYQVIEAVNGQGGVELAEGLVDEGDGDAELAGETGRRAVHSSAILGPSGY